ncbi:hypothetical protein BDZ94DRAFT_1254446 [Collybia nuda]|uniref:Uncharacterized protein n=1 Tax=Collybia nuda TaxID=64659 RepID=A0A9P5YB07_9AGAR|nr:hypothetical protein BDZ94DRAFT_1254446 [Collybia nuda]
MNCNVIRTGTLATNIVSICSSIVHPSIIPYHSLFQNLQIDTRNKRSRSLRCSNNGHTA